MTLVVVYESRAQSGVRVGCCRLCSRPPWRTCAGLDQAKGCIYPELGFNQAGTAEEERDR